MRNREGGILKTLWEREKVRKRKRETETMTGKRYIPRVKKRE